MIKNADFLNKMFKSKDREGIDGLVSFTRYLKTFSLSKKTLPVYLKLFSRPFSAVGDQLFKFENTGSYFSTISVSPELLREALSVLYEYKKGEFDIRFVFALLGIVKISVKSGESLTVFQSDMYHLGKFLENDNESLQSEVIEVLENVRDSTVIIQNSVSLLAGKIVDAWFDTSKEISTIIPLSILNS